MVASKIHAVRNMFYVSLLLLVISLVASCESEDKGDTTPPGELSVISTEATYGGAIISYTLPEDNDILYVRADYTNGKGEAVFRTVSKHVNQIEVSGFVLEEDVTVSLTVVKAKRKKNDLKKSIPQIVASSKDLTINPPQLRQKPPNKSKIYPGILYKNCI